MFAKSSILDVLHWPEYASEPELWNKIVFPGTFVIIMWTKFIENLLLRQY